MKNFKRPTMLMILDGFGINNESYGNAIAQASTPALDRIFSTYPKTTLKAVSYKHLFLQNFLNLFFCVHLSRLPYHSLFFVNALQDVYKRQTLKWSTGVKSACKKDWRHHGPFTGGVFLIEIWEVKKLNKHWLLVYAAGIIEILWVIGLKHSDAWYEWVLTILLLASSFFVLIKAMESLPSATVYAVFTGIGTAAVSYTHLPAACESGSCPACKSAGWRPFPPHTAAAFSSDILPAVYK